MPYYSVVHADIIGATIATPLDVIISIFAARARCAMLIAPPDVHPIMRVARAAKHNAPEREVQQRRRVTYHGACAEKKRRRKRCAAEKMRRGATQTGAAKPVLTAMRRGRGKADADMRICLAQEMLARACAHAPNEFRPAAALTAMPPMLTRFCVYPS